MRIPDQMQLLGNANAASAPEDNQAAGTKK